AGLERLEVHTAGDDTQLVRRQPIEPAQRLALVLRRDGDAVHARGDAALLLDASQGSWSQLRPAAVLLSLQAFDRMEHGDVRYVPEGGQPHAGDRRKPIMTVDDIVVVLAPLGKAHHATCEVVDVGIELGWGEGKRRARGDVNQSYSFGKLLHRGQVGVRASGEDINVHAA